MMITSDIERYIDTLPLYEVEKDVLRSIVWSCRRPVSVKRLLAIHGTHPPTLEKQLLHLMECGAIRKVGYNRYDLLDKRLKKHVEVLTKEG